MKHPDPIAIIPIGNEHRLHIAHECHRGRAVVTQRMFFLRDGEWLPGRAGVEFPASALDPFIAGMQTVRLKSTGRGSL